MRLDCFMLKDVSSEDAGCVDIQVVVGWFMKYVGRQS